MQPILLIFSLLLVCLAVPLKKYHPPFLHSFLQTKIESEINNKLHDKTENLEKSFLSSVKKRKLQDGRLCAGAFVQDGHTFTDCTAIKTPDGTLNGKEWCYAEANIDGYSLWGYCVPVLNYDKVRKKANEFINLLTPETRKVSELISNQAIPSSNVIDIVEKLKIKEGENNDKTNKLLKKLSEIEKNFQSLENIKSKVENLLKKDSDLKKENDQLKKKSNIDSSKNCEGLLGYEQEQYGDGIFAEYYDNENFLGDGVKIREKNINFDWTGRMPHEGLDEENFSIKFQGFIKVPVSGYYQFIAETDDGCALFINDQIVINHKMKNRTNEDLLRVKSSFGFGEKNSDEIFLVGGLKYEFKFFVYHSVHNNFYEDGTAYARLFWKSNQFHQEIIKEENFYLGNKIPPLKLSNYQKDKFILRTLREFDDAFKDSLYFKMADIPLQYRGLNQLRTNLYFPDNLIELKSDSPVTVYIGVNDQGENPLPEDFQNTENVLSIFKISKHNKNPAKEVKAIKSIPFRIYKKEFSQGIIKIPIMQPDQGKISLIFFFQFNPRGAPHLSCGGKEENIGILAFESCSSSSSYPNSQWDCEYAFSGKMVDAPFSMWATNGEGVGAWIEIKLKNDFLITSIEYKNRDNPGERNKEIDVKFTNGEIMTTKLKNTEKKTSLKITPTMTRSIRFIIKDAYGTINNGGAFDIVGLPCKENAPSTRKVSFGNEEALSLKCEDNLINNDFLIKMNYKIGDKFSVSCGESCSSSRAKIYGSYIYSEDSSICKAAFHQGVLSSSGGVFIVGVESGIKNYRADFRNSIASEAKLMSSKSIIFESISDDKTKKISQLFVGMKVDIYDMLLAIWIPGIIMQIDQKSKAETKILVSKEGYPEKFNEKIVWPNPPRVDFCGTHISNRACDEKSIVPLKKEVFDVKICFTPKTECPEGYLPDNGGSFSVKGTLSYGWSSDIQNNARTRLSNYDQLLDSLILFPPSKNSKWCLNSKPDMICESIYWRIIVPNGKYRVKVTIGDPLNKSGYWIKINGKVLVDGKILEKNQFFSPEAEISVGDETIVVSADCDRDCYYIWSRINTLEIKYVTDILKIENNNDDTVSLGCGNAFTGGKCQSGLDPLNCVFENSLSPGMEKCGGSLMIVRISKDYGCIDQRGKLKCIKRKFNSYDECSKDCPLFCKRNECIVR